jgi:ubiquinone/menaquinone biosynthesis C-methylase UbiE
MELELLGEIVACSACAASLPIKTNDTRVICASCGAVFEKGNHIWNFIPANIDWSSPLWQAWNQLQENGVASYQNDAEHNLAVVERNDIQLFSAFCHYHGLVLDVGCGPQPWPSYFDRKSGAVYVGIDPLIDDEAGEYLRLKALGEFLPFRAGTFDQVLFSTTLDHFVDPLVALKSAERVCKSGGEIVIWLGEKHPDAPRPPISPEWYLRLQKPSLAEDVFHVKRLNHADFAHIVDSAGLRFVEKETHRVDEYRVNHFYRLKSGG